MDDGFVTLSGAVRTPLDSRRADILARALGGKDFLVVTPGVRPDWSAKNDQARAATPADALRAEELAAF